MLDYIVNQDHYVETAPLTTDIIVHSVFNCSSYGAIDSYYESSYALPICWWQNWVILDVRPDFSVFSPEAIDIWGHETSIRDGHATRSAGVDGIKRAAETILRTQIGGWDMEDFLPGVSTVERIDYRKGLEVFLAILGLGNSKEVEGEEAPKQIRREPGSIYIAGRYVFGEGLSRLHTALSYRAAAHVIPTWISAFDSDLSTLGDGTLVARTNDRRDSPVLMRFTLGTVTPPEPHTPAIYFLGDLMSAHDHYRKLPNDRKAPYDAIPEIPWCPWCKGRNSNGYVSGIIAATKGKPHVEKGSEFYDLSKLTGWEYPVAASYFGL